VFSVSRKLVFTHYLEKAGFSTDSEFDMILVSRCGGLCGTVSTET
jgi:hypothetical protein